VAPLEWEEDSKDKGKGREDKKEKNSKIINIIIMANIIVNNIIVKEIKKINKDQLLKTQTTKI
jgi:hypothetical protein